MSNFAPAFMICVMKENTTVQSDRKVIDQTGVKVVHALEEEVLFIDNLRAVSNLATIRIPYNSIVVCRSGCIMVEVGGHNQVRVLPGQILLIPVGKLVQPMLVSTDVEASAVLLSDRTLKLLLGNQVNIWNKAMYMKEIYVIEDAGWLKNMQKFISDVFYEGYRPLLSKEITYSFLRIVMLMICELLLRHDEMTQSDDLSTIHDKEIFNQFLQVLDRQRQKRQRVSFYADQLNITSKYFSTICKRVSGKSPLRWITDSVMQDCYHLLIETDLSIKEISNRLGFPNSSFFGQYFREQAGVTPVEYRTIHQKSI